MFRPSGKNIIIALVIIVLFGCHQEKMVFHATSLPANYQYHFKKPFHELFIDVGNKVKINALMFKAKHSKGLIFYLHGNAGSLDSWGKISNFYVNNGYDFFIMDYRSFGKSLGKIKNENEMYNDIQTVYDSVKTNYNEKNIIIIGYSIGTGFAAKLAAENNPKQLILKAPYYSIPNLVNQKMLIIPHFLIKFKLPTYKYLQHVKCPITIFHGNKDKTIPIKSSYKLQKYFKQNDTLIVIQNIGHQEIGESTTYKKKMQEILK